MKNNFKKALVTGGAGFIGSHLAEILVKEKCDVSIIDNLSTGHLSNIAHIKDKITFFQGDIQEPDILAKAVKDCDIIFHEAAQVSVPKSVEQPVISAMINDIGTLQVLEAARQNGAKRVVVASSSAVYGDNPESPKQEDMKTRLLSPYALQKFTGELNSGLYNELYGLETVCLRYFNVYGPRQDPSSPYSGVISIFMTKAFAGKRPLIYGNGNQTRDFVFVKDTAEGFVQIAQSDNTVGQEINIATGEEISVGVLAQTLIDLINPNAKIVTESERLRPDKSEVERLLGDNRKLQSLTQWKPGSNLRQGLSQTIEWFKVKENLKGYKSNIYNL